MTRALITLPATATRGQLVEIKTLIQHPMETGFRTTPTGQNIPRDVISSLSCAYDGEVVFTARLYPAVSANPYIAFTTIATRTAEITFTWVADNGWRHVEERLLTVT